MKPTSPEFGREGLLPWSIVGQLGVSEDPRERSVGGAILVADIAGYTPISERLSSLGDEGLGRLSDLLNREFNRYMEMVAAHDGEMISFAGDALVACFLNRAGADAVDERVSACAKALAGLSGVPLGAGDDRVTLHVGVGLGRIWLACLGGWFGRWELFVGGDAVRAAFRAAGAASPGGVVVGPSTDWSADLDLHNSALMTAASTDLAWTDGLVHPRVLESLKGDGSLSSELRQVTALFVRVTGLDQLAAASLDRHQEWVFNVHETLRSISSSSGRFLIDDRGVVFVLVLGDPGNAHADDIERAFSFAGELERRAQRLGVNVSMGLATGRAFCGVIGSHVRRQYVIVGPAMNLATRLMEASSSGLLAAVRASSQYPRRFRLSSAGMFALKGVREQVAAVRVEDQAAVATELFGRRDATDQLSQIMRRAGEGIGGVALVVGDAGMGKSALLALSVSHAAAIGVRCVIGDCDLTEAASPYFALRPILRTLIGGSPSDSVETLREKLASWLASIDRLEFAPIFNALLPLQLAETATTEQLRGQTRAEVLIDLLVELVRGASAQSLAIVIEDAHWLDSASAQLVEQIAARLDRPLVLLTARPEAEGDVLRPLASRISTRLELGPLDDDAIASMTSAICGGPVEPAVVSLVQEQTGGNPFFIQEMVRGLRDAGTLSFDIDRWRITAVEAELIPASSTLHRLIASRIDGLPADVRRALRIASVIGQQIDLSILTDVLAREAPVEPLVASLARHQLVTIEHATPDGGVRFAHALIQTVAYESLLFDNRIALHRAVAEAIERRGTSGLGDHVRLVHHWSRAREIARTVTHAEAAADEAIHAGAYREARGFAELCVQQAALDPSVATPARRIRWQVTLADAAQGLGDVRQRGVHATSALVLAGRRIPQTSTVALMTGSAVLMARGVRRRFGSSTAGLPAPADEYVARAYRALAQVSFFGNDPFKYLCFAAHSMAYAARGKQIAELSGALAEIGGLFGYAGLERVSRRYFREAFTLAAEAGDLPAQAHVNMVHALYSVGRGHWKNSLAGAQQCLALCSRIGDRVERGNASIIRFWHYYYQARFEEAAGAAQDLETWARAGGNQQQTSWALHASGLCRLAAGVLDEARDLLTRSEALLANDTDPTAALSTRGSLALAHCSCGDRQAGHTLAGRTLNEVRAISPMGHAMTTGFTHLAQVMVEAFAADPRSSDARANARAAVGLLRRQAFVFPIAVPASNYWRARLAQAEGRNDTRLLRRGLDAATALGMTADVQRLRDAVSRSSGRGP
jgi:class 3 adenylate cyclase